MPNLLRNGHFSSQAPHTQTIIIDDVNADPRYLACSIETRSEIVVPIIYHEKVLGEIDIDSDLPAAFTDEDKQLLESISMAIARSIAHRR